MISLSPPIDGFLLPFLPVFLIWAISRVTLAPLYQVAGQLRAPIRFQLSDIAWLFLQLQLVLAFCAGISGLHNPYFPAFTTGFVLVTIVLWISAVQRTSRARIRQSLRRALVIMVLYPGTVGVGVVASISFLLLIPTHRGLQVWAVILAIWVTLPVAMIGLRQLSKWIVRGCEPLPVKSKETRDAEPGASIPRPNDDGPASS